MDFWNQQNFDGLKALAAHFADAPDYAAFSDYCRLKEQGLKKPALEAAAAFVAHFRGLPDQRQRAMAAELALLDYAHPGIHQLLPHPVTEAMKTVMTDWANAEPGKAEPRRWLGHLNRDRDQYQAALVLDPMDMIARAELAHAALEDVAFQCHHLSESAFLGDVADAEADLQKAAGLVAGLAKAEVRDRLQGRHQYLAELVAAWAAYDKAGRPGDFGAWCQACGHAAPNGRAYYYGARAEGP